MKFAIVFISLYLHYCLCEIIVNTNYGKIRGRVRKDRLGQRFFSFQSIPYAKPPLKELRFKAPIPAEPWNGILDGTTDLPKCFQKINGVEVGGQEDCLYLNVYTKKFGVDNDEELLPVLVYIHGGGFIDGSAEDTFLGPEYLLVKDIVLIAINYRLGIFGSLSFEDQSSGVPGNAGLKDQVQALKWVKENIKDFGGNPNSVTIFGQSAGAASVHFHVLSPMSTGLFHRAIFQSGTALGSWNHGVLGTGNILAQIMGIKGNETKSILNQLKNVPTEKIFEYQEKIYSKAIIHDRFHAAPVVEKQTNELAFLPDEPIKIIKSGKYNHVPIITGYTSLEAIVFHIQPHYISSTGKFEMKLEKMIPVDLGIGGNLEAKCDVMETLKAFYFEGKTPDDEDKLVYTKLVSDTYFVYPALRTVNEHLKHLKNFMYLYKFTAETKLNFVKKMNKETASYPGVSHLEDLAYLFNISQAEKVELGSIEEKCVERMVKLWTDFAKFGDPTYNMDDIVNIKWEPVTEKKFHYLEIGSNGITMRVNPDEDVHHFWDYIYDTYTLK